MKIWFRFGKNERLRYVSHLDLQRFMQRALNRTELPIAWSQGFSPHPVMSFASALAMGWTSEYEVLEVKMAAEIDPMDAARAMTKALPPDMPVLEARALPDIGVPAPMALLRAAEYRVTLSGEGSERAVAQIPAYMAEECVMAMRKTKTGEREADIRKMTLSLSPDGERAFLARLSLTEALTLKPDLLARTLCSRADVSECGIRIHRITLLGEDAGGELRPLMDVRT